MSYIVDNAVIMAAGTSSRFAPLSFEKPKALIEVRGEVLIERQIRQLLKAGIDEIVIVVGYMKERFSYLKDKYGVLLVENNDYLTRNNNASIYAVKDLLKNTYICSSDNYFSQNPFDKTVDDAYYAAVYSEGDTMEWCMTEDVFGFIDSVTIGGKDAWYMLGHTFWSEPFSKKFIEILETVYDDPATADMLWEKIYMNHLDVLKMRMKKYPSDVIYEFDTLDELRLFDASYVNDTRSEILKDICKKNGWAEKDITEVTAYKSKDNTADGFMFVRNGIQYKYEYNSKTIGRI